MKSYSSMEILTILHKDGWYEVRQKGSHLQLQHPIKLKTVTIPHPKKDLNIKTVRSIMSQAGLEI